MKNNNYRVLIVDDIEENLQVVGSILGEKKLAILFAKNGKQAIKIAQKKLPDLILLDINMPEMNGYTVCDILKKDEHTKEIPIIFLSALNEKSDIIKGFQHGGVDYVTKPFNKEELLSRVFTHLELKHSKNLVKKQNEKLTDLNATKDKFFSIIAHDLKNPFYAISGLSELLFNNFGKYNDEKKLQFIKDIYFSSKNTNKLLENLLTWSRSQSGKIQYNYATINLKILIFETVSLLQKSADKKEIKLINKIDTDIYVYADRNTTDTIIRNLVSNAIKFTNKKGTVTINTKPIQTIDNKKFINISISDSGVGISPEKVEKLFTVQKNISTEGTDHERGTGLGLILCNEFTKNNGGEMTVESTLNEGSTFCFSLPTPTIIEENLKLYNDEAANKLAKNIINTNGDITNRINKELLPQYELIKKSLSIKRINAFINTLDKIATEFKIEGLYELKKSIEKSTQEYNVSIIEKQLEFINKTMIIINKG